MSSEYLQMVIGLMDAFLLSRWVLEVVAIAEVASSSPSFTGLA
jgi:hypothetical protein